MTLASEVRPCMKAGPRLVEVSLNAGMPDERSQLVPSPILGAQGQPVRAMRCWGAKKHTFGFAKGTRRVAGGWIGVVHTRLPGRGPGGERRPGRKFCETAPRYRCRSCHSTCCSRWSSRRLASCRSTSSMTRVWHGVIVSPETISQRAKLLRDALGDDPRHPRYVASVRGRGYRLTAEVTPLPATARPVLPAAAPAPVADATVPDVGTSVVPTRSRSSGFGLRIHRRPSCRRPVLLWQRNKSLEVAAPAAEPAPEPAAAPPPRSVAVLPFDNLSPGAEGKALALGIPETVLHLLAGIRNIDVTARTSSFAFREEEVGRALYRPAPEGTLPVAGQRAARSRPAASDGAAHRGGEQRARMVSPLRSPRRRCIRRAGRNRDQRRARAAAQSRRRRARPSRAAGDGALRRVPRVSTRTRPVGHRARRRGKPRRRPFRTRGGARPRLLRRVRWSGPVGTLVAEYEPTEDRYGRFDEALHRARGLIARAIALDPENAEAYLAQAHFAAYDDLAAAEADYRRALDLNPSAAEAYAGLAAALYESPARRDEAFALLQGAACASIRSSLRTT